MATLTIILFLFFTSLENGFCISGVIWRKNFNEFYPIFSIKEFLDYEEKFDNTSYPNFNYRIITNFVPVIADKLNFNESKIHLTYFEVSFACIRKKLL